MKKLFLSIAIISAITVGAIVVSAETNEGNLGYGKSPINEIEDTEKKIT